ncbi:MAG: hypothetical protein J5639_09450 [Bacteroidales bacterium]|nr:hypothetical protein [Bacteroidales bacterium]
MTIRTFWKKALIAACAVVSLCSCADYSKIVFSDFKVNAIDSLRYSLMDMRGIVHSSLTVDNPYFAMSLKDLEASLVSPEGESVAEVKMDEGVIVDIAAKSQTQLEAPLRVHVSNPLKLLSQGMDAVTKLSEEGYVVNYSLSVSKGRKYHKISKKNIPLESFIKMDK